MAIAYCFGHGQGTVHAGFAVPVSFFFLVMDKLLQGGRQCLTSIPKVEPHFCQPTTSKVFPCVTKNCSHSYVLQSYGEWRLHFGHRKEKVFCTKMGSFPITPQSPVCTPANYRSWTCLRSVSTSGYILDLVVTLLPCRCTLFWYLCAAFGWHPVGELWDEQNNSTAIYVVRTVGVDCWNLVTPILISLVAKVVVDSTLE